MRDESLQGERTIVSEGKLSSEGSTVGFSRATKRRCEPRSGPIGASSRKLHLRHVSIAFQLRPLRKARRCGRFPAG